MDYVAARSFFIKGKMKKQGDPVSPAEFNDKREFEAILGTKPARIVGVAPKTRTAAKAKAEMPGT